MLKKSLSWIPFYTELAHTLLGFKDNRSDLVTKIPQIYQKSEIHMPTLETDGKLVDIDPFTFFGLFNKHLTVSNRIKIISAIAELVNISEPVPTSFDSIPILNNQNATYYAFLPERDDQDIPDLWELFDSALAYADNQTSKNRSRFSHYFNIVINKKNIGNSKLTMGLYWISPDTFLNFDSRNEWFIYKSGKIPQEVVDSLPAKPKFHEKLTAEKYFAVMDKLNAYLHSPDSTLHDFKELSYEAWTYSQEVNDQIAAEKKAQTKRESSGAAVADEGIETVHYWLYSPGNQATYWDEFYQNGIMAIGWDKIGNLAEYPTKEAMRQTMRDNMDSSRSYKNAAHATWQFANEMKPGDIIFVKKGMHLVIGRGVVTSDYEYDEDRDYFKNVREVKWTHKGEWPYPGQASMKTLTDITAYTDYVEKLNRLFEEDAEDDTEEQTSKLQPYTKEDFLNEVFMDEKRYDTLATLVLRKKNVILQGAPGVGKTYAAKRLAYSIMGEKDPERVMMVQFHQSYSYEDFVMGWRPTENGFELRHGAFYDFCKSAEVDDEDTPYFFIIDEINRGNLSKIFGELFMLIEPDKRGIDLQLLYADEKFSVPKNVYIIGMMNTADRSLAIMDYALRRRFAFFTMEPGFATDGFREYQQRLGSGKFNKLISCVEELNHAISHDASLGEGFQIGHSFFCELNEVTDQTLSGIVEYELVPLLDEYWFDEPSKARMWAENLRSAIQ